MKPEDGSRSRFRNIACINKSYLMILSLVKILLLNVLNGAKIWQKFGKHAGNTEVKKQCKEEISKGKGVPNIVRVVKSRRMRWAGHVARIGQGRGVYMVLVGKPEGKRPLGRPRRRWEDNIKMDLQEVGGGCEDWMELAQDRDRWRALVGTVMNIRVPKMRRIS